MEKMPFHEAMYDVAAPVSDAAISTDWRQALPVLQSKNVTLREMRLSDAPSLLAMLNTDEVARFISPPPTTVDGFERFITWALAEQRAGRYACFAVVAAGMDAAIGIIQVRQLESTFTTAEWGFAIGSPFWGTGIFIEGAKMVLDFTFNELGVHRLEARAALRNGRGNAVLRKLGAVPEAVLRQSFLRNGEALDQQLWAILACDWQPMTARPRPTIH